MSVAVKGNGQKKKHHFVPVFHLDKWTDETSRLFLYRRGNDGTIECNPAIPDDVLRLKYLYRIDSGPDAVGFAETKPDMVEDELAKIDTRASVSLTNALRFLSGERTFTNDDAKAWVRYVRSLIERHPKRVAFSDDFHKKEYEESMAQIISRYPDSAENFRSAFDLLRKQQYPKNVSKITLLNTIDHPDWWESIKKWEWKVLSINPAVTFKFLLTDDPVLFFRGASDKINMLALPLSPTIMWMAFPKDADVDDEFFNEFLLGFNIMKLQEHPRFVISSSALPKLFNSVFDEYIEKREPGISAKAWNPQ